MESLRRSAACPWRRGAPPSSLPAPPLPGPSAPPGSRVRPLLSTPAPPSPAKQDPSAGRCAVPTGAAPQASPPRPRPGLSRGADARDRRPKRFAFPPALRDELLARRRRWHPRLPAAEQRLRARLMNRGERCQLLKIKGTRRYGCRQEHHQLHRDLYYLITYIKLLHTFFKPGSALTCPDVRPWPIHGHPLTPVSFILFAYFCIASMCSAKYQFVQQHPSALRFASCSITLRKSPEKQGKSKPRGTGVTACGSGGRWGTRRARAWNRVVRTPASSSADPGQRICRGINQESGEGTLNQPEKYCGSFRG